MRWWCVLVCFVAGCASTWERHTQALADYETHKKYAQAAAEARWLIDNTFVHAPDEEKTPAAEAKRYMHLADLAAKAGNPRLAVEALREAVTMEPLQARAVRAQIERLPLSPAEIGRIRDEFAWNLTALAPGDDQLIGSPQDESSCWSYRVREVRIHRNRTVSTPEGMQRQVTYDVRPWSFDPASGQWRRDGDWVIDAGTELEMVDGPHQPRYRALMEADSHFVAEDPIPPCHRTGWRGPYDARGTVFVAAQLPTGPLKETH